MTTETKTKIEKSQNNKEKEDLEALLSKTIPKTIKELPERLRPTREKILVSDNDREIILVSDNDNDNEEKAKLYKGAEGGSTRKSIYPKNYPKNSNFDLTQNKIRIFSISIKPEDTESNITYSIELLDAFNNLNEIEIVDRTLKELLICNYELQLTLYSIHELSGTELNDNEIHRKKVCEIKIFNFFNQSKNSFSDSLDLKRKREELVKKKS